MHDEPDDFPEGQRTFPWEDVEAARNDRALQKRHAAHRPVHLYGSCPGCQTPAAELTLIYFRSPSHTWRDLCGTQGWLTLCDACHLQVQYLEEALSWVPAARGPDLRSVLPTGRLPVSVDLRLSIPSVQHRGRSTQTGPITMRSANSLPHRLDPASHQCWGQGQGAR